MNGDALLRRGLLADRVVLAAVAAEGPGAAAAVACEGLGARLIRLSRADASDEDAAQAAAVAALDEAGRIDTLVVDLGLETTGEDPDDALLAALAETWNVVRAAANAALIPQSSGKIVLIGPRPSAGQNAEALRAGLENMARTLSIEWSRHQVLTTMIAPGAATTDDEVASLVMFLASPAGDYYSGCRFELGSV
ncbi:MAG: hypothetical protein QOI98_1907 [Solirubrobacteraceae bacterium]|nr:hypothetical protein [Solirubrobacteraceae bacterium]